jgi:hypothetical protein
MDTIIIVNCGYQSITCEGVSQDGRPLMNDTLLIQPNEEKTVYTGSSNEKTKIKISVGYHPTWNEKKEQDRSTMPKPKLSV